MKKACMSNAGFLVDAAGAEPEAGTVPNDLGLPLEAAGGAGDAEEGAAAADLSLTLPKLTAVA